METNSCLILFGPRLTVRHRMGFEAPGFRDAHLARMAVSRKVSIPNVRRIGNVGAGKSTQTKANHVLHPLLLNLNPPVELKGSGV